LIFQQIDIDHYTSHPMINMPGAQVCYILAKFLYKKVIKNEL
jgi:hypothetical protein